MTVMNIHSLTDVAIQQKIGERLKTLRLRQNITQLRLATEAQVSLSSIKKIERGDLGRSILLSEFYEHCAN